MNASSEVCKNNSTKTPMWKDVLKNIISSLKDRTTKISHKRVRALIKKEKRKLKRQFEAKSRDERGQNLGTLPLSYINRQAEEEREQRITDEYHEREKKRLHYLWLKREEQAAIEFKEKFEAEKRYRLEKEEQIKKLNEELKKLDVIPEGRPSNKEVMLDSKNSSTLWIWWQRRGFPRFLQFSIFTEYQFNYNDNSLAGFSQEMCKDIISKLPEGTEPWHNPIAPQNYITGIVMERKKCQFFSKTGACRFGDRCSRSHEHPTISCTILIHNMFSHFSLDQAFRDEYDTDLTLEYEDSDTYQQFKEFYEDVLPEFRKLGKVIQFKVCCNQEPHLRGNVYVQFSNENEATEAYKVFNGRWYASRQLSCEFSPVTEWKLAICGLFHSKRCPKGRTCNFLHVFQNPTNEFWAVDKGVKENQKMQVSSRRSRKSHSRSQIRRSNGNRKMFMSSSPYSDSRRSRNSHSPNSSRRSRRSRSTSPGSSRGSKRFLSRTPELSKPLKRIKRSHSRKHKSSSYSRPKVSHSPKNIKHSQKTYLRTPETVSQSRKSRSKSPDSSGQSRSKTPEASRRSRKSRSKSRELCKTRRSRSQTSESSSSSCSENSKSPTKRSRHSHTRMHKRSKRSRSRTSESSESSNEKSRTPIQTLPVCDSLI